jgi:predicted amino acid dehydrogenase
LIDDGKILSEQYPNILFTIGDNGTVVILRNETLKILERCGMSQNNCKILIIGPYGFLGEAMVKSLLEKNYEVIGLGSNISGLKRIQSEYGIDVFENYEKIGKVDIAIACTHSDSVRLNEDNIDLIRKEKRKLLVVDVSEPSNLSKKEYLKCKNKVIRIDAGNAYSKNIKYVLGYISYKMLRLQRGITFGCFSESLVLASEMSNSDNQQKIIKHNWFEINKINMDLIEGLFEKYSITYPSFRCFGKRVKDFDMNNKLD